MKCIAYYTSLFIVGLHFNLQTSDNIGLILKAPTPQQIFFFLEKPIDNEWSVRGQKIIVAAYIKNSKYGQELVITTPKNLWKGRDIHDFVTISTKHNPRAGEKLDDIEYKTLIKALIPDDFYVRKAIAQDRIKEEKRYARRISFIVPATAPVKDAINPVNPRELYKKTLMETVHSI